MIPFDGSLTCWALLAAIVTAGGALAIFGAKCDAPVLSTFGSLAAAGALAWGASPAFADDTAADLVSRAQARGRAAETALRDWAGEVARRGEAYEAEARALSAGNAGRLRQGLAGLEASGLFGTAVEPLSDEPVMADGGVVYVAVSFSMEPEALRALAVQARRAGAVLVVRGFVSGSVPKTLAVARTAFDENAASGVAIDPQVFRAFKVTRVPTFIAATSAVAPCEGGVDCTSPAPANDRLAGNISLTEALRILASRGREAPDVARGALSRLEG